jgi:hypothetical protein
VNTERHKVYEIARITETLSNFLSNEIAAMGRDERMFTPLDLEIAVHKRILEAYEAGEIAMREKAANVCRTWDELIPAKWIADKIEALAISGAEESKKEQP